MVEYPLNPSPARTAQSADIGRITPLKSKSTFAGEFIVSFRDKGQNARKKGLAGHPGKNNKTLGRASFTSSSNSNIDVTPLNIT